MRLLLFLVSLTIFCNYGFTQNYNLIMGKAIKKAIGFDLKNYQIFSYPTDNFGLITSYENTVSDSNFLCDMWNCIGIDAINSTSLDWLTLNNFAGVGSGGTIELSQKKKTKVAVDVILPKVFDVLGVTGKFRNDRTTEINITIGKAYLRKLRRDKIVEYINSLSNDKSVKKAYNNGILVIVVADCVIEDMSVTITVDQETSTNIDAKLGINQGNENAKASKVFKDASLSVNVEKISSGKYSFKISHPVIFARLSKKQPTSGSLGSSDDFEDWTPVVSKFDESKIK